MAWTISNVNQNTRVRLPLEAEHRIQSSKNVLRGVTPSLRLFFSCEFCKVTDISGERQRRHTVFTVPEISITNERQAQVEFSGSPFEGCHNGMDFVLYLLDIWLHAAGAVNEEA